MSKRKVLNNISWMVGGKIAQNIISVFVSAIVARYLGANNYGILAYTAAFVAFFTSIATLGLNNISVKYIIDKPKDEGKVIGTILGLKIFASTISTFAIGILIHTLNSDNPQYLYIAILQSIGLIFQSFDIINYWYQSKLKSKVAIKINLFAYLIMTLYKILILILAKSIEWFAFANTLDFILIGLFLYLKYRRDKGQKIIFSFELGKEMVKISYHFIISGLMVAIYAQMDKIMIGEMIGTKEVGYYATAIAIVGMTNFLLEAIIDSVRPIILNAKNTDNVLYIKRLTQLHTVIIWVCIAISIAMTIFAELIILILYGSDYLEAAVPLRIITWYTIFSYIGVVRGIWLICEKKQKYIKWILGIGVVVNLTLNLILIPIIGINGAAIATLFTQITTAIIAPLIFKETREHVKIVKNSFIFKESKEKIIKIFNVRKERKKDNV